MWWKWEQPQRVFFFLFFLVSFLKWILWVSLEVVWDCCCDSRQGSLRLSASSVSYIWIHGRITKMWWSLVAFFSFFFFFFLIRAVQVEVEVNSKVNFRRPKFFFVYRWRVEMTWIQLNGKVIPMCSHLNASRTRLVCRRFALTHIILWGSLSYRRHKNTVIFPKRPFIRFIALKKKNF